ncbi:DUF1080 domain-containing protein [Cohnella ginsengisoli]|uniref:DUF1080 domain-containing protein n=1 Tax=Cohnella ginsengisoli TaxID=425004 RepID=A0A9X4KKJ1_9BACL|nr:family 16 glycoside hydrolase [Cohnella ginsengisoli]MDG0793441.1 DUF1080 domain-containing protein [Cohnella ginsengisoli]
MEDVVFDDALAWTRAAAFKVGMDVAQPQIGVTFKNSYVYQSDRALLIEHGYQYNTLPEEGYAQNITFENIDVERVEINQFGNYWLGVSASTSGDVSNVLLKNINLRQLGGNSSRISGNATKGGMVNGVAFSDVYVKGKLATSLSDLKMNVNSNVNDVVFANSKLLFDDNFEDGDMAGWTSVSGGWYVPTVGANNVLSSGSRTVTSLTTANAGGSWTDYAYEAKTRMGIADANAGIAFRVQDAYNYYMYRINSSNQKLELYKSVNGQMTLAASTPFTAVEKQWYTMKAVVQGNRISCYVDGQLKMEWTNPAAELKTGGIGFRTTSAGVHFDDAKVSPIIRFSDDFEDGNTTGWTAASGSWSVSSDGLKVLTQHSWTAALMTVGDSWTDYSYEASVKMPVADANAGILFRVQDTNNYYMYRINASNQKLELYKSVSGQLTLVSSTPFAAQANQWYAIKASVKGNAVKGYVDGALKTEWTNPVAELTAGKVGFRTTSADVSFDDAFVLSSN